MNKTNGSKFLLPVISWVQSFKTECFLGFAPFRDDKGVTWNKRDEIYYCPILDFEIILCGG